MTDLTFRERIADEWLGVKNTIRYYLRELNWKRLVVTNRLVGETYEFEFREFLLTGKLGSVTLGMNQSEVFQYMGVPLNLNVSDQTCSIYHAIHLYGDFEVYVLEPYSNDLPIGKHASVKSIRLSMRRKRVRTPYNFVVNGYMPGYNTTLEEFRAYLEAENIPYALNKIHFKDSLSDGLDDEWYIDIHGSHVKCYFVQRKNAIQLYTIYHSDDQPGFLSFATYETIYTFQPT